MDGYRTGGDAFAFALGYYEGDYKPINPNVTVSDSRDKLWEGYKGIRDKPEAQGLYNGNISWMSTDLPGLGQNRMQGMVYGYDQLHRIVQARSLSTYDQNGLSRNNPDDKYDADYSYDPNGNLLTLDRLDGNTSPQDNLTYEYYAFSNKLKNVDGSEDENYTYDEIGNLISDEEEGITTIDWTPYGKVRKVVKDDNSEVLFRYDASGNRIAKITATDTTIYARDASGNVMAVYKSDTLIEQSIYGSSRLGLINYASKTGYRSLGGKKYELSNHLGNVLAVVSDNIHLDQDSTWTSLINTTDYYPFGLVMDGRSVQDSTYRYGFNGYEKEDDIKDTGNSYDFGARIYDPRKARFLSIDPKIRDFPFWSPYLFAANNPIRMVDVFGEGPGDRVKKAKSMVGTQYKPEKASYLRTGTTKEAIEFMDCAEFVCRVLAADKVTPEIEHMTSSGLKTFLDNKQQFVHSTNPQVGDVAVWDGHVGIVTSVDKDGKIKLTHARGEGKLAQENPYHISPQQYRSSTFHGYYKPINENDNSQDITTIKPTTRQQAEDNIIYNGGTLREVVVVGERTTTREDRELVLREPIRVAQPKH